MGEALRVGALERPAKDEMAFRSGNGRRAAGKRLLRARHFQPLLEPEHDGLLLRPSRIRIDPITPSTSQVGCSSTVWITGFHSHAATWRSIAGWMSCSELG